MTQLNLNDRDFMANTASRDPPTEKEVGEALKDLATRLHKSPGLDHWGTCLDGSVCGAGCEGGPSGFVPESVIIWAISQSMA